MKTFTKEKDAKWVQLLAPGNWESDVIHKYRVGGVPCMFLIDPDGKILLQNMGLRGEDLIPTLNRFLVK